MIGTINKSLCAGMAVLTEQWVLNTTIYETNTKLTHLEKHRRLCYPVNGSL